MSGLVGPHLAGVFYRWGLDEQSCLLVRALAPGVAELRRRKALSAFWFDRFDARGPHLMAVLTVQPGAEDDVRELLARHAGEHFEASPVTVDLTAEELERRHAGCGGKTLCAIDAEPGFGAAGSVRWCPHGAGDYPLRRLAGLAVPDQAWRLWDRLTAWTIGRLEEVLAAGAEEGEEVRRAAAVGWLAALGRELEAADGDAEPYWRHHARSVVPGLSPPASRVELAARLDRALGATRGLLDPLWERGLDGAAAWSDLPELLECLRPAAPQGGATHLELLRELSHVTLKQLGLPIHRQRALLLYGWRRALEAPRGPCS